MGLVSFVFSTLEKCIDIAAFLLDLNFVIVHNLIMTVLAVFAFLNNLPTLIANSLVEVGDLIVVYVITMAETTTVVAHCLALYFLSGLGGLLESLKMVGYLFMHVLLRGKEQFYRGLLSLLECCSIALSLVFYFTNTVVNYALIAIQNLYSVVVSMWQAVSSPLQMILELTLTLFSFVYSSLVGTSNFLWSPCKVVLDFLVMDILVRNIYYILPIVVMATILYRNPEWAHLGRLWFCGLLTRIIDYMKTVTVPARLAASLYTLLSGVLARLASQVPGIVGFLLKILHHLYLLERRLWQQLVQHGSWLVQALRTQFHRVENNNNNRRGGNRDQRVEQRDPPDGSSGDGAHHELLGVALPSSSTHRPLKKQSSATKDGEPSSANSLLSLLDEHEQRRMCVICQDTIKTVVLLPCRHLCLCRHCANVMLRQPILQQNCPLCRQMIVTTLDVYL